MSERDDMRDALAAVAKADPFALIYPATVIAQNADGTLDLRLSGVSGVSLEPRGVRFDVGIPGCRVIIAAGSEVKVAFAGGSPDGIYAFGLPLDIGATRGVVAVGDLGAGGTLSGYLGSPASPIQFIYTPPGGAPIAASPTVSIVTKATNGSAAVRIR